MDLVQEKGFCMGTAINQIKTMYCVKNSNSFNDKSYQEREENHAKKVSKMKRMINGTLKEDRGYSDSILDSIKSYGESIKASRTASQKTNQSVKKLRYNFKKISSQLMRCKTSVSARLVAGKARREVVKLKQDLVSGNYNEDDLQIAINHAESIERAARKKVRHLQEEELIKIKELYIKIRHNKSHLLDGLCVYFNNSASFSMISGVLYLHPLGHGAIIFKKLAPSV